MKITEILAQDRLSVSFEVFPPKLDAGFDSVRRATEEIAALHPSFMSVTYGAGGGTSRYTLDIARNIKTGYIIAEMIESSVTAAKNDFIVVIQQREKRLVIVDFGNILNNGLAELIYLNDLRFL